VNLVNKEDSVLFDFVPFCNSVCVCPQRHDVIIPTTSLRYQHNERFLCCHQNQPSSIYSYTV